MDRITRARLNTLLTELNELTNSPLIPYTRENNKFTSNVGNYHLYGAYGGIGLHRMVNEGGGVTEVFGISTKRELYEKMKAMIKGIYLCNELKGA